MEGSGTRAKLALVRNTEEEFWSLILRKAVRSGMMVTLSSVICIVGMLNILFRSLVKAPSTTAPFQLPVHIPLGEETLPMPLDEAVTEFGMMVKLNPKVGVEG